MASDEPPSSNMPPSLGPGARPLQPGERSNENTGSLLKEIIEVRSHYNIHLASNAIELAYELQGQKRHYNLPFDKIPIGGWTRALCYGGTNSTAVSGTLLIDLIRGTENASGRQITQEEAEGIAFYSSRRILTMYVGQFAAIGTGLGAAWWGRKEMKFPFRAPKPPETYESFPLRVLPILKGQYARVMWQITRANVWIIMWLFLSNPLFRSMADTRMTVGLYQDRRTHDLTQLLKGKVDRLKSNRASEALPASAPLPQVQRDGDDASPSIFYDQGTNNNDPTFAGDQTFTDGNAETEMFTDRSMQQRQTERVSPNSWNKSRSRVSQSNQEQPPEFPASSSSSDIFFDDASPTAGNDPEMGTPTLYEGQPAGSAWSRVRRNETPHYDRPVKKSSARQSQDFQSSADSFSFSESDQERQLAKQQAQKDFDSMLDKERRDGGSGEYNRDMQATAAGGESNSAPETAWSKYRKGR